MSKRALIHGVAAATVLAAVQAGDFPMQFKALTAEEVMGFPGGYGLHASLALDRPASVTREPPAVSKRPIYGLIGEASNGLAFRLDESRGTGLGYDRLIVDLNRNGNLADDPVATPAAPARQMKPPKGIERTLFGPIQAPTRQALAGAGLPYYAQMYLSNRRALTNVAQTVARPYLGYLRFKAGWHLEGTVQVHGRLQRIGAYDGDSDFGLGTTWQPHYYGDNRKDQWYFQAGDSLLWDANASGKFENSPFSFESSPWSALLYLGPSPCRVKLAADWRTVSVEPWGGALADLDLQPQGAQVRSLLLAREIGPEQWELVKAQAAGGKASVPAGKYRLYWDAVAGDAAGGDTLWAAGYYRKTDRTVQATAGRSTVLRCGGPLEIKLEAEKDRYRREQPLPGSYVLNVQAEVLGQAGETFSTFGKGRGYTLADPAPPTFRVVDASGRKVADGKMEFG